MRKLLLLALIALLFCSAAAFAVAGSPAAKAAQIAANAKNAAREAAAKPAAVAAGFELAGKATGQSGEVELQWNGVQGAGFYQAECQSDAATFASEIVYASAGSYTLSQGYFKFNLGGLKNNTQAGCYVVAYTARREKIAKSNTITLIPSGPARRGVELKAWATGKSGEIALYFNSLQNAAYYRVECSPESGSPLVKTVNAAGTGYISETFGGLQDGTKYTCQAIAYDAGDTRLAVSNVVIAIPTAFFEIFVEQPALGAAKVSWSHVNGAEYYLAYANEEGKPTDLPRMSNGIRDTGQGSFSHTFDGLEQGKTYILNVFASRGVGGEVASSEQARLTIIGAAATVFELIGAGTGQSGEILLTWGNSLGAGQYYIAECTPHRGDTFSSGKLTPRVAVGAPITYKATGLQDYMETACQVIAYAGNGTRIAASKAVLAVPYRPFPISAGQTEDSTVTVSWESLLGATEYTAYAKKYDGTRFTGKIQTGIKDTGLGTQEYVFTGLDKGVEYAFMILAFKGSVMLASSEEIEITIADVKLAAVATGKSGEVELRWNGVQGAGFYQAECQSYPGILASEIVQAEGKTSFTFRLNGLKDGQTASCVVVAYTAGHQKIAASNNAEATPSGSAAATGEIRGFAASPGEEKVDFAWEAYINGAVKSASIIYSEKKDDLENYPMASVYMSNVGDISGKTSHTIPSGAPGIESGKTYYFRLVAFDGGSLSANVIAKSGIVEAIPKKAAPPAQEPQFFIKQGGSGQRTSTGGSYSLKAEPFSIVFKSLDSRGSVYFGAGDAAAKVITGAKMETADSDDLVTGKVFAHSGKKFDLISREQKFYNIQLSATAVPEGCEKKGEGSYECEAEIESIDGTRLGENAEGITVEIAMFGDFSGDRKLSEAEFAKFTVSVPKKGAEPAAPGTILEALAKIGKKFAEQVFGK